MRKLVALALLALPIAGASAGPRGPAGPDIVVFLADDLGWQDVSYAGGDAPTPHIDAIAARGVQFDTFYVWPLCSQSRAALLTGRYPTRYGLTVGYLKRSDRIGLPPAEVTLAEVLRGGGYRTAIFGKWHLGHSEAKFRPANQGFDLHYRCESAAIAGGESSDLLAAEAVRWIEEQPSDSPLFAYVAFHAVHIPIRASKEWLRRFADEPPPVRRRKAAVAQMDAAVGSVLEALERRRGLEHTVALFLSDNGPVRNEGPDRGGKGSLLEGGVRVPAVMMWSGMLEAGTTITAPAHAVDLLPTLAGLAGATLPEDRRLDGIDLWPGLAGGQALPSRELLLGLYPGKGALRAGRWKLLGGWDPDAARGARPESVQLYDLSRDSREEENLAAERPEVVRRLVERLQEYREAVVDPPPTPSEPARTDRDGP